MTTPVICGLVLRFEIGENLGASDLIAGPALYAALACAWAGEEPRCLVRLSTDVTQAEVAAWRSVGVALEGAARGSESSLVFETPPLQRGETQRVRGNPLASLPEPIMLSPASSLFCANTDPVWILSCLDLQPRTFLAMDLHPSWLVARPIQSANALSRCALVSATEDEMRLVPPQLRDGWAESKAVITLTKCGKRGVRLDQGERQERLPAPDVADVRCDVGAGDLCFGLMAAAAMRSLRRDGVVELDDLARGYLEGLELLTLLLTSDTPRIFLDRVRSQSPSARSATG